MLEFSNVKVYDLKETVISCRNAMRLDMPEYTDEEFEKGLKRAIALSKNGGGTGHTSFRKGIRVAFDMKYTQYITKQFQRYHWFDYIASSSLMHRITKMDFSKCVTKYVTQKSIDEMFKLVNRYNFIMDNNISSFDFTELPTPIHTSTLEETRYVAWMMTLNNCPMGTELFVRVTTNYEQLATIYKQRKHHKLKEDYQAFRDMVEGLPYAKELIL